MKQSRLLIARRGKRTVTVQCSVSKQSLTNPPLQLRQHIRLYDRQPDEYGLLEWDDAVVVELWAVVRYASDCRCDWMRGKTELIRLDNQNYKAIFPTNT